MESNCRCTSGKKGRPAKKRVHRELSHELRGSNIESGEELETETERKSCLEFKSLIKNIPFMKRELALVCTQKLAESFNKLMSVFYVSVLLLMINCVIKLSRLRNRKPHAIDHKRTRMAKHGED